MAFTRKRQNPLSPAAQRKRRKTNNVNLHAAKNDKITVVSIGASAGGLSALQEFFAALTSSTGMTFVVITHRQPEHESHMAEILQRGTRMPVQQVTGLISAEKDPVYVIPPNHGLVMEDGQIGLSDYLQQRIFAIQMQLSFVKDAYDNNDLQSFPVDFSQLDEWLADAIKVTRKLSVDLSPPILHGEGMVGAIIGLAAQMDEQYGFKIDIKANGRPAELGEKVRVLVFYAIRELLFNIVKHAETSEATVRFEHYDCRMRVAIKDQEVGFDSTVVMRDPNLAHGLSIIRHRLNPLGCSIQVNSQPGNGTEAIIEVPYEKTDT